MKPEFAEEAGALVRDENTDRRRLYEIIAAEQKTTPDRVAERNAIRNFQRANAGEWLKGRDGWYQKR